MDGCINLFDRFQKRMHFNPSTPFSGGVLLLGMVSKELFSLANYAELLELFLTVKISRSMFCYSPETKCVATLSM